MVQEQEALGMPPTFLVEGVKHFQKGKSMNVLKHAPLIKSSHTNFEFGKDYLTMFS